MRKGPKKIDGRTREGRELRKNGATVVAPATAPAALVPILLERDLVDALKNAERLTGMSASAIVRNRLGISKAS